MLTSPRTVLELTGKEVTTGLVAQAQRIVESYMGRMEAEIGGARDKTLAGYAVAYQAAYMLSNADTVYEQVALASVTQGSTTTRFDEPTWLAPLARQACKGLSWNGSKSVHVGRAFDTNAMPPRWRWRTQ